MNEPDPLQKELIADALDRALSAFEKDIKVIFPSESIRLAALHEERRANKKHWTKPSNCVYPGCIRKSVARSHTIQKTGPLCMISQDQHLLHPKLHIDGSIKMQRIGINNASVFPGFCSVHEQLFESFERTGEITSSRDIVLQAFRVVAREIVRAQLDITQLENTKKHYIQRRNAYVERELRKSAPKSSVKEIRISNDSWEDMVSRHLTSRQNFLSETRETVFKELLDALDGVIDNPTLYCIDIPDRLPVCLSGIGLINCTDASQHVISADVFLCVIPAKIGSKAILATKAANRWALDYYCKTHLSGRFAILAAIESWMINQTDHWFITPSTWNALPPARAEELLELLATDHTSMGFECSLSIFDKERLALMSGLEKSQEFLENEQQAVEEIAKERARLTGRSTGHQRAAHVAAG